MIAETEQVDILEPEHTHSVIRYSPTEAAIAELRREYAIADATTPEGYEKCRKGIALCRKGRGDVERARVEYKAEALAYGRMVDSEAKRVTSLLLEVEEPLRAAKEEIDEKKAAAARAVVEAEKARIAAIEKAAWDEEQRRLEYLRHAENERLRIESERLAKERAELEADRAKIIAERESEAAKRKAEQDIIDANNRKVAEAQRAEKSKIDADLRAIREEKERLDRIEFERAVKEQAERDAAANAERNRIEAERLKKNEEAAVAAEQQRAEAAKPDAEKLASLAVVLREIDLPLCSTDEAKNLVIMTRDDLVRMETAT